MNLFFSPDARTSRLATWAAPSPSMREAFACITGPVFTVPGLPYPCHLQFAVPMAEVSTGRAPRRRVDRSSLPLSSLTYSIS